MSKKVQSPIRSQIRIGIVAPSAKVPQIELELGADRIREAGFLVDVHSQCRQEYLFFAGKDEARAGAFFEYAKSPEHEVIWCARGGHGAIRLLPLLDRFTEIHGKPPRKLLVGYSDVTALMEYVRSKWGWSTLHAPMPSMRKFTLLDPEELSATWGWIRKNETIAPWAKARLKYWTPHPKKAIRARLVGGNLTVWNCLLGTRYEAGAQGRILFFEDVDESLYRIDRMLHQLAVSKSIEGVRAVVLGNFMNCRDHSPLVLKDMPSGASKKRILESPRPEELKPLRGVFKERVALRRIFSEWGNLLKIPVAFGLPVGHGPDVQPLPLGAEYSLSPDGQLKLLSWDWLGTG